MKARVCDRCGAVIGTEKPDEENNDLDVYFVDEPELSLTDLCEKCKAEFSNLLVGYMAPYRGGKTVEAPTETAPEQSAAIANGGKKDRQDIARETKEDFGIAPEPPVREFSESVTAMYPIKRRQHSRPVSRSLFDE
jgi:hypothetical protein